MGREIFPTRHIVATIAALRKTPSTRTAVPGQDTVTSFLSRLPIVIGLTDKLCAIARARSDGNY